jgi:hypothetical protein
MKGDIIFIHNKWMELLFERQVDPHPVVGKEKPNSEIGFLLHYIWSIFGVLITIVAYPAFISGLTMRKIFISRILGFVDKYSIMTSISILVIIWSLLSILSYSISSGENTLAVASASIVAVTSALISYYSRKYFGRLSTLLISYPAAYTAFLLPPVTFALIHSSSGSFILEFSSTVVIAFKNIIAEPLGIRNAISETFDLVGINYLILWIVISTVMGWITAFTVEVSKKIRD